MSIIFLGTGTARVRLVDAEETEIVPAPPEGFEIKRVVTRYRFNNNDSAAHTPDIRVKSTNQDDIANDLEYFQLFPKRKVAALGHVEDDRSPVYTLTSDLSLTTELDTTPTDADDPPTVYASWVDQVEA